MRTTIASKGIRSKCLGYSYRVSSSANRFCTNSCTAYLVRYRCAFEHTIRVFKVDLVFVGITSRIYDFCFLHVQIRLNWSGVSCLVCSQILARLFARKICLEGVRCYRIFPRHIKRPVSRRCISSRCQDFSVCAVRNGQIFALTIGEVHGNLHLVVLITALVILYCISCTCYLRTIGGSSGDSVIGYRASVRTAERHIEFVTCFAIGNNTGNLQCDSFGGIILNNIRWCNSRSTINISSQRTILIRIRDNSSQCCSFHITVRCIP